MKEGRHPIENTTFIFHDMEGRRWPRVKRWIFGLNLLLLLGMILFVRSLLVKPELRLPFSVLQLRAQLQGLKSPRLPNSNITIQSNEPQLRHSRIKEKPLQKTSPTQLSPVDKGKMVLGFYANNEHGSTSSFKEHANQLTHLSPNWLFLKNDLCELELRNQVEVEDIASSYNMKIIPLLNNKYEGWRGDLIEGLITGPRDQQDSFIRSAIKLIKGRGYDGVTVDFEEVAIEYSAPFNDFLVRFAIRCHEENLLFLLCIPVGLDSEVFDLDYLAEHVDFFIGMLYYQNSRYDPPGPIASQPWFERWLKRLLEFGKPQQWIIGLGAFGYDWPLSSPVGKRIRFAEVMDTAADAKLNHVEFAESELNPTFAYEEDSIQHTIWFLDAVTALNQAHAALKTGVAGLAIWQLGSEDPNLWDALRLAQEFTISREELHALELIQPHDEIIQIGDGEIIRAEENLKSGSRTVRKTKKGAFSALYTSFPSYTVLEHYGQVDPNWVALTFDDGPSRKWTPQILDVLQREKVPATFFVIGRNVEKHPELVQRMLREGHEIGNHSYTHPDLTAISDLQIDLQLNATQRLLESVIGRSTSLFRPPFHADSRPQTRSEILPILRAQKLGYVTICENIDPEDWFQPGAETILQRIKQQRANGSVILLHDAGGDRFQTVEALPQIIHWLREQSDGKVKFVTTSQLLGLSRDDVMPIASTKDRMIISTSSFGLRILYFLEETIWAFMIIASVLVITRTLSIGILAMIQKRRQIKSLKNAARLINSKQFPPVSVLIAAYNEEAVINGAVRSVLTNGYEGEFELIVVDDGSTDRTKEIIEAIVSKDSRVKLYSQPNSGKSAALVRASCLAKEDFFILLDADTQLAPGAIRELIGPLVKNEKIGAVSGNTRVGNRGKWLTEFQSLEYTCGFNLDRRAYDLLNCITVVPGAIGAYRRSAIKQAGGFTAETLAEDTDLTIHIRKNGWRITYAENAIGWTESPETLQALIKQRFRWAFGTLQCLWKHHDALFHFGYGALGWVALPSLWFFQVGLVAASPLIDLLMLISLIAGNGIEVALYFAAFVISDVFLAGIALKLEGENIGRALLAIPQRFIYRPMLSLVVWQALLRAIRGAWVGWGKQERTASVRLKLEQPS